MSKFEVKVGDIFVLRDGTSRKVSNVSSDGRFTMEGYAAPAPLDTIRILRPQPDGTTKVIWRSAR